jgi:hypothetical protein
MNVQTAAKHAVLHNTNTNGQALIQSPHYNATITDFPWSPVNTNYLLYNILNYHNPWHIAINCGKHTVVSYQGFV